MGGVNLDDLVEDLATIERYMREPDRFPGPAARDAFQRTGARIPMLVAEIRDHRANCARLLPEGGQGWFVLCPKPLNHWGKACTVEWPSHDMLTPERMAIHLHEGHKIPTREAWAIISELTDGGRLPKASNT